MRTVTAPELVVLAANTRVVAFRVKMANGEPLGTSMIDLSKYVESVSIESDIDQPVSGATVTFRRDASVTQSLSPLRTDSTLNRLDDGVTYAPQVDVKRNITIEEVTIGVEDFSVDYKLIFKGTTDTVSFEHSPISVTCRDLGAVLVDNFIETETVEGTVAGRSIELVMQDILDDAGLAVIVLYTPVSPGFNITEYKQQPQSAMDALSALQQLIGWDTRYKWDGGTSAFRLTLSQPDRAKTVPDYTFGPGSYFDVTRLELDLTGIRNSVKVSYRIAATGVRSSQTYTDATSAAKYGHRFMLIQESDTSPIDTAAKALALATVAVLDLKEPKAEQELELPFFWPAELGDLYRFTDNKAHYNGNQDWAVVSVKHEISRRHHRTVLRVRGSPAGGYLTWLSLGTPPTGGGGGGGGGPGNKRKTHPPPSALAPIAHIFPLNTETDSTSWELRFTATAAQGGGFGTQLTYTIKRKLGTATEATLSSGNATAFPLDLFVARHLKASAVVEFTITDQVTLLTDTKYYPLPSQRTEIGDDGVTLSSFVVDSTARAVNRQLAKALVGDPDTLDSVADGTTHKKIVGVVSSLITPSSSTGRSRCQLYNSGNQSITTATNTDITWDSETFDVGGLHNPASNPSRITIPAGGDTGLWLLVAQIEFAFNATGDRAFGIRKNATTYIANVAVRATVNTLNAIVQVSALVNAPAVGDYFEVRVYQDSGGNLNVIGGAIAASYFAAHHIW